VSTFIYTKKMGKPLRSGGRILTFTVYRLQGAKRPKLIGETRANTGSYKGDSGHVSNFIAKKMGYRCTDGYFIDRKDVMIYEV